MGFFQDFHNWTQSVGVRSTDYDMIGTKPHHFRIHGDPSSGLRDDYAAHKSKLEAQQKLDKNRISFTQDSTGQRYDQSDGSVVPPGAVYKIPDGQGSFYFLDENGDYTEESAQRFFDNVDPNNLRPDDGVLYDGYDPSNDGVLVDYSRGDFRPHGPGSSGHMRENMNRRPPEIEATMPTGNIVDTSGRLADTRQNVTPGQLAEDPDALLPTIEAYSAQDTVNTPVVDDQGELTGNARGSKKPMGRMQRIMNTLTGPGQYGISPSEKLIRLGGRMVGASSQGGLAAMEAFGDEYSKLKGEERVVAENMLDRYNTQLQAEQEAIADNSEALLGYDESLRQMESLYNEVSAAGDQLTGPWDGTIGKWWDNIVGNPEAATRLRMDQFKVDQVLMSIAKTKGAISDREMAIFERPLPSDMSDEKIWLDILKQKYETAKIVRDRLARGTRIDYNSAMRPSTLGGTNNSTNNSAVTLSPDAQKYIQ